MLKQVTCTSGVHHLDITCTLQRTHHFFPISRTQSKQNYPKKILKDLPHMNKTNESKLKLWYNTESFKFLYLSKLNKNAF